MAASWEHCPPEINPTRKLLDTHATAGRAIVSDPTPMTASANQDDQVQR
ncbi:hypothetical protein [Mycolicibacterium chlorophenolicum]|uniref:Uncharacterized protein n=1 Tax=Mycolicibacterium chlorophenolicum TaxID=37916 RepID=A0A0J6WLL4_9MYCO|nr:hypothetical protein [Mycolicibacterium chlorophenolicum]KMO82602.1 hypothetical protein MCHLDSM_01225 [Mycolicibacterium chlorophenolicum]